MAKKAYKKLARLPNGTNGVVHIDVETGKEVPKDQLKSYEIISAGGQSDLNLNKEETTQDTQEFDDVLKRILSSDGNNWEQEVASMSRTPANKYGWIDIPSWLEKTGKYVPAAKVAVGVAAASNVVAKNAARESMGLPPLSLKDGLRDVIKAQDPKVADVQIGKQIYSVTIDGGPTKDGRTSLTPNEARNRAGVLGGLKEATPEQSTANEQSYNRMTGQPNSFVNAERFGYEKNTPDIQVGSSARGTSDFAIMPERPIHPGLGLQNLTPNTGTTTQGLGYGAVTHNNPRRNPGGWDEGMTPTTREAVQMLASMYPNGIALNSATRSSKVNRQVGGQPNSEHLKGNAIDWDISKMTDAEKAKAVENARIAGFERIGSYSSNNVLHLDKNEDYKNDSRSRNYTNDGTWPMMDMSIGNMGRAQDWFSKGLSQDTVPTPTPRPENFMGVPSEVAQVRAVRDVATPTSPAMAAALGYTPRSQEDKSMIALALAGELSGKQLERLAAGDTTAMTEIANMITSIENRAGSGGRFGTNLDSALVGSQYNSLLPDNMRTTMDNYQRHQAVLDTVVGSYYDPNGIKPSSYDFTHYYNPDIVSPSWGTKMGEATNIGDHRFGILNGPGDVPNPYANGGGNNSFGLMSIPGSSGEREGGSWTSGSANSMGPGTYGGSGGASNNSFGNAEGSGYGSQGLAGATKENTGFGPDAKGGSNSFGGFAAGNLGGSASGMGSGFGAAGSSGFSSFGEGGGGKSGGISVESATTGQDISDWGPQ